VQVAYTAGYGAVIPAYSQPMMSAGQMSHDDTVANHQPVNGHMTAHRGGGEEFVGSAETEFTGTEEYYSAAEESFVPVHDVALSQSPVDNCLSEEVIADKPVFCSNVHVFVYHLCNSFR